MSALVLPPPWRVPGRTRRCSKLSRICAGATRRCSTASPTSTEARSRGRCGAAHLSGQGRAVTSGCSSAPPNCCGLPRPEAVRCSSWTMPTTPTRQACGCCTICRAPRSASGF